jgi:hypothetical protein
MDIGDVDGDNDLDLISSCFGSGNYKVYQNSGNGTFTNTPITLAASSAGSCITVHDRDNDGDLDLAGIDEVDDLLFVYSNNPVGISIISSEVPGDYKLHQNYPNPFNPSTKIRFEVAKLNNVELKIYNAQGKEIQTLVNGELKPGIYEASFESSGLPSGVYFYKLASGSYVESKKMVLLK